MGYKIDGKWVDDGTSLSPKTGNGTRTLEGVDITETVFIPIEWAEDGTAAPDAAELITDTNGKIRVRQFAGDSSQEIRIPWQVPANIKAADGIKFTVNCVVTNATGRSSEEIEFKMSGYCAGDNDPLTGTFGDEIASNKTSFSAAEDDVIITPQSTKVTVTGLAAGELAMLYFYRDHDGNDDYAQKIGVSGIVIEYTKTL